MKSTAVSGVKQNLKPYAYKVSEPLRRSWRAFCLMSLRVSIRGKLKPFWGEGAAKASLHRATIVTGAGPEAVVIYPWPGCSAGNTA